MKKLFSTIVMGAMLAAAIPLLSIRADAQTRYCNANRRHSKNVSRNYRNNYRNAYYENAGYSNYAYRNNATRRVERPNVYQRHRKAFNIGIGTGAGALLGALIGGKKGALIGAAAGAGGGYIATKVQSPKNYYRYRR